MNAPVIRLESRQQQTLTPRLQQAVRLLQLSSLDFAQEIQQALDTNPFLEPDDDGEEGVGQDLDGMAGMASVAPAEELPVAAPAQDDHSSREDAQWDTETWGSGSGASHGDSDVDMMDLAESTVSLRDHLHRQVNVMPLSERDRLLAAVIVEALDDDGYLRLTLEDLQEMVELDPLPDETEMQTAIRIVQSLEPNGVGARDIRECLLLQVCDIPDEAERALAERIVAHHLEQLAQRDISRMAKALGSTVAAVEAACERVRHLDPRPGWRFGSTAVQFVTPDVIVRKVKGEWQATLNPSAIPKVRLNKVYAELFQSHRESHHGDLASHLQEARWTVRNVEQRFATILRVAEAIVKRQKNFLEYGALAMKPLGLKEIAEELGLHESTVSRVTNNKYLATPAGVFELKYFFSRALPTSSGGACSATAIRGVIKDLIDGEEATNPLSDAEIARLLARQGLQVARRTVTKYRQMMRVPAVEMRRQRV